MEMKELSTVEELKEAYPVMKELRTHLSEAEFIELVQQMQHEDYQLFGCYDDGELTSLAGVAIKTNLYLNKHVFVYDLVTADRHRSKGYGEKLLTYLENWGQQRGAHCIALESGVQRTDAHRFYEQKMDFSRVSYSFRKSLS